MNAVNNYPEKGPEEEPESTWDDLPDLNECSLSDSSSGFASDEPDSEDEAPRYNAYPPAPSVVD